MQDMHKWKEDALEAYDILSIITFYNKQRHTKTLKNIYDAYFCNYTSLYENFTKWTTKIL